MSEPLLTFDLQLRRQGFRLEAEGRLEPGITALFGPSGCGKTTLLRCLAGLEKASEGVIRHDGSTWQTRSFRLPAHRRPVGLVFQDMRLFEHMSVAQNFEFARRRRRAEGPRQQEVVEVLGVAGLLDRMPAALSGGEAQRVALGRALLAGPRVLLMDEPLAGLDHERRARIMPLVRAIPERFGVPLLYVTHTRQEVLTLADRVMLMDRGGIVADDRVADMFSAPACWPALGGIEPTVVWDARVVARDNDWGLTALASDAGRLRLAGISCDAGTRLRLLVAARDVVLTLEPPVASSALNGLPVQVESLEDRGNGLVLVRLTAGRRAPLWAEVSRQSAAALRLAPGRRVHALIRPQLLGVPH
ncbi:molybdenum ABC transporter ATP-binding protein [Spiribacter onubensis]|uniref:Molybdenum ABC transporter ATP-binding protein n=1 Tax=Spiribacter onubensis TaxID=3122420 RepID=A0ABV3SA18_9GAMM